MWFSILPMWHVSPLCELKKLLAHLLVYVIDFFLVNVATDSIPLTVLAYRSRGRKECMLWCKNWRKGVKATMDVIPMHAYRCLLQPWAEGGERWCSTPLYFPSHGLARKMMGYLRCSKGLSAIMDSTPVPTEQATDTCLTSEYESEVSFSEGWATTLCLSLRHLFHWAMNS